MSYIYFAVCWKLFGLNPEPFYWTGIGLHAAVAVLLYFFVLQMTKSVPASWAAGIFFAAYERHQEAVMWISAANETTLAVNCMAFLLLWKRAVDTGSRICGILAYPFFALALLSKEASVVLVPMAMILLYMSGHSLSVVFRKSAVLMIMAGAYGTLWLAMLHRNFFVQDGHYDLTFGFITVYLRAVSRLVVQALPLAAAWMVLWYRQRGPTANSRWWLTPGAFFGALLLLSVVPYTFLIYQDHLPSRNTYFPSIGLAGLVGILFASMYSRLETPANRRLALSLFSCLVIANSVYVWMKKEPQYRERAAPTRELIETLNAANIPNVPVRVCGFPLDSWTFTEAVTRFTRFKAEEVVLDQACEDDGASIVRWDHATAKYTTNFE
jgi:hypothetical protein